MVENIIGNINFESNFGRISLFLTTDSGVDSSANRTPHRNNAARILVKNIWNSVSEKSSLPPAPAHQVVGFPAVKANAGTIDGEKCNESRESRARSHALEARHRGEKPFCDS